MKNWAFWAKIYYSQKLSSQYLHCILSSTIKPKNFFRVTKLASCFYVTEFFYCLLCLMPLNKLNLSTEKAVVLIFT